jgi:hypothetical protein
MLIEMKGFVFCRASGGKIEFELMPWDCRLWGETAQDGRIFVKEHLTTVEVPDDFDPRPSKSRHWKPRSKRPAPTSKLALLRLTGRFRA